MLKSSGSTLFGMAFGLFSAMGIFSFLRRRHLHGHGWRWGRGRCGGAELGGGEGHCGAKGASPEDRAARMQSWVNRAFDRISSHLELDAAQKAQLHPHLEGLTQQASALKNEHHSLRAELLEQWKSDAPDRDRLRAGVNARVDALRGFLNSVLDAALEVHRTLSPAQRQKITARVEAHHACGRC